MCFLVELTRFLRLVYSAMLTRLCPMCVLSELTRFYQEGVLSQLSKYLPRWVLLSCCKDAAIVARDFTMHWLNSKPSLILHSKELDKYGRVLGTIETPDGLSLGDRLVVEGLAHTYYGGTKQAWTKAELKRIVQRVEL
jgi:hypothetical protein